MEMISVGFDSGLQQEMDRIIQEYGQIHDELEYLGANKMVFTWHWWLDVALAVLPWIVWVIVRDRKRTHSFLYAGFFSMLIVRIIQNETPEVIRGPLLNGASINSLFRP